MQYMLLIYSSEDAWESLSEDDRDALYAEYGQFGADLRARNAFVAGDELQATSTATTVRVRDGESLISDGPFAETKETLGGYYLIEADSLDEAIQWASRIPSARHGAVEVRPVVMRTAEVSA
jgi:hypothetical protein